MSAPFLRSRLLGATCAALLVPLAACEPPVVYATQDPTQSQANATTRIEGSVVVLGKARGNVLVFLYDAANPPPPAGKGSPLAFALVPEAEVFGASPDANSNGPFTGHFVFSRIKPGHYLVTGLVDHDYCPGEPASDQCQKQDFIPWFFVTNQPDYRDVAGLALADPTVPSPAIPRVVEVKDVNHPVTDVSVTFNDTGMYQYDRPAFAVSVTPGSSLGQGRLDLDISTLPVADATPVGQRRPTFIVRYVDDNNDGVPDDANRDGNPEFWPKVLVRKIAANDPDNLIDETGLHYDHVDGSVSPNGDVVILGSATVPPMAAIAALQDKGTGKPSTTSFTESSTFHLVVVPQALDISNPAAPVPLKKVPSGRYSITVVNPTTPTVQTWRVPNELQPTVSARYNTPTLPPLASQSFYIEVP